MDAPLSARGGYGKCLNVNERTLTSICGAQTRFGFRIEDIASEPEVPPVPVVSGAPVFAEIPARANRGMWTGMDIGGTDVKVVAALDGKL